MEMSPQDEDLLKKLEEEQALAEEDNEEPQKLNSAAQKRAHFEVGSVQVGKLLKQHVKANKVSWIRNLVYLDGAPFDFTGREYLYPIYNGRFPRLLLKFSRQCEKCVDALKTINLWDGSSKLAKDIIPGDILPGWDFKSGFQLPVKVVASETNGTKPILNIKIRSSSELSVTENHPIYTLSGWKRADELKVGDRIASPRTVGSFGDIRESRAYLIGLLYGDGHFTKRKTEKQTYTEMGFTVANTECEATFLEAAKGQLCNFVAHKKNNKAKTYRISSKSDIFNYFLQHNLFGQTSSIKKLPESVYSFDKVSTIELLRGLWATDGYCKTTNNGSRVELTYCTTSPYLKDQIRILLRKFGIITKVRQYQPKRGNLAYLVTVVCRSSLVSFYKNIGPVPDKPFTLPAAEENSHYDIIPTEVIDIIDRIRKKKSPRVSQKGYVMDGLGEYFNKFHKGYALNRRTVTEAAELLDSEELRKIVSDDIFWDEVVSISYAGERETWAIQTENETFISDFVLQHNSTFLANSLISDSAVNPYNKAVYVSPSYLQTRQFSAGKLTPWMEDSPVIRKFLLSNKVSSQVFEKGMTNGSLIFLRSAFLNADRVRGLSANTLALDEIQNFISANIPVIMEVLSHSADPTALFAGTPLTNDNIIEQQWQESSQCEWLVKCERHDPVHYNFLDERCIGRMGPICNRCGKPINPANGTWVAFSKERDTMGFHLNQIMVPWMRSPKKWKEIVWKLDTYSKGQFYNEVLGISFDSASKPVTRTELVACTSSKWKLRQYPDEWTKSQTLFMGVDWGTGSDGSERDEKGRLKTASYTVVTIGCFVSPTQYHVFFMKRYEGDESIPSNCIRDIIRLAKMFDVKMVGVDWGFGWAANDQLEAALGQKKIIKWQYVGMQKERAKYDPVGHKITINRTEVMSDFFSDLKKQRYLFPAFEEVGIYLRDIEHIFAEQTSLGHLKFDHKKTEPDDFAHSVIFGKEAADLFYGRK